MRRTPSSNLTVAWNPGTARFSFAQSKTTLTALSPSSEPSKSYSFGQTSAKLIEKYKALPGAVYENTTNESLKGLEKGDTILSADEIAKLKKHFKKSEQVQIQNVSEEQLAEINKDIKALKNHELLFETVRNAGSESLGDSANVVKHMISDFLNPTIKMRCYGKVDGKMVSDLLIRLDIWNTVALSYIDTKIDRDIWMKLQEKSSFSTSDDDDDISTY